MPNPDLHRCFSSGLAAATVPITRPLAKEFLKSHEKRDLTRLSGPGQEDDVADLLSTLPFHHLIEAFYFVELGCGPKALLNAEIPTLGSEQAQELISRCIGSGSSRMRKASAGSSSCSFGAGSAASTLGSHACVSRLPDVLSLA